MKTLRRKNLASLLPNRKAKVDVHLQLKTKSFVDPFGEELRSYGVTSQGFIKKQIWALEQRCGKTRLV